MGGYVQHRIGLYRCASAVLCRRLTTPRASGRPALDPGAQDHR